MNEKRDARESENQKNMMRLEHFFRMRFMPADRFFWKNKDLIRIGHGSVNGSF